MAKRDQTEFRLHCWLADYLRQMVKPGIIWFHPANGEKRGAVTGARLKRMGLLPGTPDFVFILPGGKAAFIELKRPKGTLSLVQRLFLNKATALGCSYKVATTGDEARAILSDWGIVKETYKRGSAEVAEVIHGEGPL